MNKALFDDLVQSLREAKAISRGRMKASRRFRINAETGERTQVTEGARMVVLRRRRELDVKAIREKTELSQSQFAAVLGVSVRTLQNWEQQRRKPMGPARSLLTIVMKAPEIALKALQSA